MVFTFWEGKMPPYIELCMQTWKFDYILLNYDNLHRYTDFKITDSMKKRFTLPQIADCVRVHVLRDNGGYWLDTDTIMLSDELPKENMIGYPETRNATIGFLHTEKCSDMYNDWAWHQEQVINDEHFLITWDVVGNYFVDKYIQTHNNITIADVTNCWVETYMIPGNINRHRKYNMLYFENNYKLSDLRPTNMLMLHNSWTPDYYKRLSKSSILDKDCTMSNILREVLA